jgi:hypothetical protein
LRLPVIMVNRPAVPDAPVVETAATAAEWVVSVAN